LALLATEGLDAGWLGIKNLL